MCTRASRNIKKGELLGANNDVYVRLLREDDERDEEGGGGDDDDDDDDDFPQPKVMQDSGFQISISSSISSSRMMAHDTTLTYTFAVDVSPFCNPLAYINDPTYDDGGKTTQQQDGLQGRRRGRRNRRTKESENCECSEYVWIPSQGGGTTEMAAEVYIVFHATKRIKCNSEILWYYGQSYWKAWNATVADRQALVGRLLNVHTEDVKGVESASFLYARVLLRTAGDGYSRIFMRWRRLIVKFASTVVRVLGGVVA
jgi:hypothetical protein